MATKNKETQYELVEISKLIPYVNNTRTHSEDQIIQIAASIKEFGFINPIIISEDNTILCGHARYFGAKKLELEKVPCIRESHLSEAQKKAYIIADNKLAENAGWNNELLNVELSELQDMSFDLSLLGFDEKELTNIFDNDTEAKEDEFDVDAELEQEPFVKEKDVWLLGRHRLMCGDAIKEEYVNILLDGKKANCCITDPPYNCAYEGGTGMKIKNDKWEDGKKFYQFLLEAFKNAYKNLTDGGAIYIFHSDAEKVNFFNATVDAGFHYSTTCIWVKDSLCIGRMDYQMKHEPVIYAFKDTAKHKFYGDRKQTTVWEFARPKKSELHPTMKPIPLVAYPMRLSSQENGIILDLFAGAGSTLIAAQQTNRIAYTMELDPKYASAIVKRYIAQIGNNEDVFVLRDGNKIPCKEIYTPTSEDLNFKDGNVTDR